MPFQPAIPILRIYDEQKAYDFYLDYLGFTKDWEHRFEPHFPVFMQLSKDNCRLYLSEHHGDGTPGTKVRISCTNIEGFHRELRSKSYRYLNPGLEEVPWAKFELRLSDPFSNQLIFFEDR